MTKGYYTYRICVANYDQVKVEVWDTQYLSLGQPYGPFRYHEKLKEITPLLEIAQKGTLNDSSQTRALGEALFDVIFNDSLCYDFVRFYDQVVRKEKQILRVELDIDERSMPEVAALPWEFLCLPKRLNLGTIWIGTAPRLVFSRRRKQWIPAQPIQLDLGEKLKIALVVSAPVDLSPVAYKSVQEALEKLASKQGNPVDLLPIVTSANPQKIDAILSQEPHIFHFIGHGRLRNEGGREVGQIALVDPDFNQVMWVDADYFSERFNRHCPGVVMLQACEGGKLSESQAFVGVASSIVEQNVPVVVAMQYEVTNSTATRFARHFYEQLAKDKPVDIAAQEGRHQISLSSTQYYKRDFATPVIFMRVQDGNLFQRNNTINSSKNLGSSTQLPFTQKQEKIPILSTSIPSIKDLEETQDTELIIPSVPGTQPFEFTIVRIDAHGREVSRAQKQNSVLIEDLGNGVILEMVVIPGGEFLMGSPDSEGSRYSNERPQHSVTIQPFLISKYPITQAQWREVACLPEVHQSLKLRPSRSGGKSHPVTKVSWYDAVEFCVRLSRFVEARLSQKTAYKYRLPSEAEWEYACRAGTTTPFHFGKTITTNLANYDGNYRYISGPEGIYRAKTTPVGDFKIANNFGLFDMHGNVLEWCLDHWHNSYENAPTDGNEWLDNRENKYRVKRGGSWRNEPLLCRSSSRKPDDASKQSPNIGFRIVCSL
jgi:formylglycine-generating enzyme required for sulfatase activity